jgi:hypothetical protein
VPKGWARGQLDYTTRELNTIIQEINDAIGYDKKLLYTCDNYKLKHTK